jgi:phage baseplate assembly protein W
MYKDLISIENNNTDVSAINNSIKNILLTRRGSVPGIPRFGSDLHTLIFSQLDTLTETVAKSMIMSALNEFEDRINVKSIELKQVPEYNRLVIEIIYVYRDQFNTTETTTALISINQ